MAPATMPAVSAARTSPHTVRPNVASATVGPSTFSAPCSAMLKKQKPSTTIHTQGRLTNSVQPSRSSLSIRGPSADAVR